MFQMLGVFAEFEITKGDPSFFKLKNG